MHLAASPHAPRPLFLCPSRVVHCAIGSDIAGSLRFPALYCGLYTHKASAGRLSDCTGTSFAEKWPEHGTTGDRQVRVLRSL